MLFRQIQTCLRYSYGIHTVFIISKIISSGHNIIGILRHDIGAQISHALLQKMDEETNKRVVTGPESDMHRDEVLHHRT